jgi:hypothetical protein
MTLKDNERGRTEWKMLPITTLETHKSFVDLQFDVTVEQTSIIFVRYCPFQKIIKIDW